MALVTGVLGSVISKLGQLLKEEYKLQKGVRKKIARLSLDLESMQVALRKVAEVPPKQLDEQVKLWARDVRELSYDADDIIDTFLVRDDPNRFRRAATKNRFRRAATKIGKLYNRMKARHQIGGMIKTINEQAEQVAARRARYKVDEIVAKPATKDPRLPAMYAEVTRLVGIDKSSGELISMLSLQGNDGSNKKTKMVSVVGVAGLGKTTLAKAVYDKLKVDFQCAAFVPVGRNPDLKKVFRDVLIELDKRKYMDAKMSMLDERQLIDELRECLGSKRYLVVVDDIWDTDWYETIKLALVENNSGSRVITTSRKLDVAKQADEFYELQPLAYEDSRKLLYTRIFGAEGKCPDHTQLDDKVLKKCGGVPLAIITMASLLVGKSREEWIEVCRSVVFRDEKKKNQQVSDTEWILSLSYYDLPAHLKTCLLYLSAFPEDYDIHKGPLIQKWVAEGFVHNEEPGTSLFEVGEGYFYELVNRSLIQAVESTRQGIVIGCRLHDMVLDLLRLKSQEHNFITISTSSIAQGTSLPSSKVRRLANQDRMVDTAMDLRHVRTFVACRSDIIIDKKVRSFQLLRVLALEYCNVDSLEHVENLLHLRYLGLKGVCTFELPEGIGALKFLQTLDLDWDTVKELPSSLGLLTQLICLRTGNGKVPNEVIQKLTSLENLKICCSDDMVGQFVKDLGKLCELRVLDCRVRSKLDRSMQSDLVESLGHLRKIRHLILDCRNTTAEKAIWDAAVLPRPLLGLNAEHMEFTALPPCINPSHLPHLTHLVLRVKDLDEQGLKILGALPDLRHLQLQTESTVTVNGGCFHKLRSCSLPCSTTLFLLNKDTFTIWSSWDDQVAFGSQKGLVVPAPAVMPNLVLLYFYVDVKALIRNNVSCDKLGLEYLPSLQSVKVRFYSSCAFADDVDKEEAALRHAIQAHPNRPTLQINYTRKAPTKGQPLRRNGSRARSGTSRTKIFSGRRE